ncbi:MAG: cytochrome c family protein [Rhizobiales bacterium]|nr:cytochrome c family protein [Hyphomicrobiales bacterium]
MESDLNKYLMGFLGTCFVVMSIGIVSDSIFAAPNPDKPGYAIEAEEGEAGGTESAAAGPAETPIAVRLQTASVEKGEAVHKKCVTCHTTEKGGPNKTGPNLWDIVDRPVATHEGFSYSAAMKDFSKGGTEKWTYENLDHFLTSPKGFIKGTAMGFAGDKKPDERADLIAYLRSLSDSPKPLPAADAAQPAASDGTAPAASDATAKPAGEGTAAPAATDAAKPAETAPAQ